MQFVPETGPWVQTYKVQPSTRGVMLATGDRDIALSGGALGHAVVVGWRFKTRTLRFRRWLLGRQ